MQDEFVTNAIRMQTFSNIQMYEQYIVNNKKYTKFGACDINYDYFVQQYIKEHSVLVQIIYRKYINE